MKRLKTGESAEDLTKTTYMCANTYITGERYEKVAATVIRIATESHGPVRGLAEACKVLDWIIMDASASGGKGVSIAMSGVGLDIRNTMRNLVEKLPCANIFTSACTVEGYVHRYWRTANDMDVTRVTSMDITGDRLVLDPVKCRYLRVDNFGGVAFFIEGLAPLNDIEVYANSEDDKVTRLVPATCAGSRYSPATGLTINTGEPVVPAVWNRLMKSSCYLSWQTSLRLRKEVNDKIEETTERGLSRHIVPHTTKRNKYFKQQAV